MELDGYSDNKLLLHVEEYSRHHFYLQSTFIISLNDLLIIHVGYWKYQGVNQVHYFYTQILSWVMYKIYTSLHHDSTTRESFSSMVIYARDELWNRKAYLLSIEHFGIQYHGIPPVEQLPLPHYGGDTVCWIPHIFMRCGPTRNIIKLHEEESQFLYLTFTFA